MILAPVDEEFEEEKQEEKKVEVEEEKYEPEVAFCEKTHKSCGHACKGVSKERKCLPCLNAACA